MEDKRIPDWKTVDPSEDAFDYYQADDTPICVTCKHFTGGEYGPCSVCIHQSIRVGYDGYGGAA